MAKIVKDRTDSVHGCRRRHQLLAGSHLIAAQSLTSPKVPPHWSCPQRWLLLFDRVVGDRYWGRAGVCGDRPGGAVVIGAAGWVAQQRVGGKDLPQLFVGAGVRCWSARIGVVAAQVKPVAWVISVGVAVGAT
jgi:hypothetical protein